MEIICLLVFHHQVISRVLLQGTEQWLFPLIAKYVHNIISLIVQNYLHIFKLEPWKMHNFATAQEYYQKKKEMGDYLINLARKVYPKLATDPVVCHHLNYIFNLKAKYSNKFVGL